MGRALAVLLWLITLFAVVLFSGKHGWFPEAISEHGPAIDAQFIRTLIVVAIAFCPQVAWAGCLAIPRHWQGRGHPYARNTNSKSG
jgi:uncharacterized membrane protein YphA (DoxX/SURF4 family)